MSFRKSMVCKVLVCAVFGALMLCVARTARAEEAGGSKLVGAYQSHGSKNDPFMNLSLGADGTATLEEDPGSGSLILFGHWSDAGGQVSLTFNHVDGQPAEPPMTFEPTHDGLQAVTWDHVRWGKATPPPMKKGWKVKQSYWFTTVR